MDKRKIGLILVFFSLLLVGFQVFGAYSYLRTPSGYTIENPVVFDLDFDTYAETGCESDGWALEIFKVVGDPTLTACYSQTHLTHSFELTLPLGSYDEVKINCECYE